MKCLALLDQVIVPVSCQVSVHQIVRSIQDMPVGMQKKQHTGS